MIRGIKMEENKNLTQEEKKIIKSAIDIMKKHELMLYVWNSREAQSINGNKGLIKQHVFIGTEEECIEAYISNLENQDYDHEILENQTKIQFYNDYEDYQEREEW